MAHHLHRLGEGIGHLLFVPDVDCLGMDLASVLPELGHGRVVLLLAGAPDTDIGAGFGHRIGHAEPDTAVAAGHQRHLAGQIEALVGHAPLPNENRPKRKPGGIKPRPVRSVNCRSRQSSLSVSTSTISESSLALSSISVSSITAMPSRALAVTEIGRA